eukprot:4979745-Alexandrium_andersonii.AAC.1
MGSGDAETVIPGPVSDGSGPSAEAARCLRWSGPRGIPPMWLRSLGPAARAWCGNRAMMGRKANTRPVGSLKSALFAARVR